MAKQSGLFLMVVAILLVVLAGLATAFVSMTLSGSSSSISGLTANYAYDLAQTGLEAGNYQLLSGTCDSSWSASTSVSGMGEYQYRCNQYNATTTTTSALTTTSTSIPLNSVTGIASLGAVTIDSETIYYNGISGTTLLNARRGQNSTTAASHLSGATVSQSQYVVSSQAGAPDLTTPNGKVTLNQAALVTTAGMASYYAAGTNGTSGIIMTFNGSSWNTVVTAPSGYIFYAIEIGTTYGLAVAFNSSTLSSIIYSYNGAGWTMSSGPNSQARYSAAGCDYPSNPTRCWIGGTDYSRSNRGGVWSYFGGVLSATSYIDSPPNANYAMGGISCINGVCEAAGSVHSYAFASNSTNPLGSPIDQPGASSVYLTDVNCPQVGSCLITATNGSVFYYNGTTLLPSTPTVGWSLTYSTLNASSCGSTSSCMVVGNGGLIFNCSLPMTGVGSCSAQTSPGTLPLLDVHCNSATDCVAVGGPGSVVYRYSGSSWLAVALPGTYTLNAINGLIGGVGGGGGGVSAVTPIVQVTQ